MPDTEQFLSTLVEPQLEVMRRISSVMGAISIRHDEEKLVLAAYALARAGWLEFDCKYPACGATYHRFIPGSRLDMTKLRGRW